MKKNKTLLFALLMAAQTVLMPTLSAQSAPAQQPDSTQTLLALATNKSARKMIRYDLPGISNQSEKDRFGLWAGQVNLDASANKTLNLDHIPIKEYLRKEVSTRSVTAGASIFRLGKIYRNTTSVQIKNDKNFSKNSYDGIQTTFQSKAVAYAHSSIFRLNQHFAAGVRAQYDVIKENNFEPFSFFTTRSTLKMGPAIEINLLPYRIFYKRYWIIGAYYQASHSEFMFESSQKTYQPGFYCEAASLTRWGFWQAGVGRIPGSFLLSQIPANEYYGNIKLSYNLGRSLYTTVHIVEKRMQSPKDNFGVNSKSSVFEVNWGLDYYFGRGHENVLNPRMSGI
jgi:hypothetical protein